MLPNDLQQLIPDVDTLLALEPEELGWILLRLAKSKIQNGIFWPFPPTDVIQSPIDRSKSNELELAFGEAWNWLRINSLVIPASGINGANGFLSFSRRAKKLIDDKDFQIFKEAMAFPRSLLHPSIADKVWLALARGDLDEAVFAAFKAVEVSVRETAGLDLTDIGTELMRKAFHSENGVLTNKSQPKAERESLAHLFAGAIGSYKNPHSHRTVSITDPREAQEMVVLASHLLRIVETRKPKNPSEHDQQTQLGEDD